MRNEKPVSKVVLFSAQAIAAGQSVVSEPINVEHVINEYALQATIAGDGTCKFEYLCSLDGLTYVEPEGATDILASLTKTSGPGTNGKVYKGFTPPRSRHIQIRCTETGGANAVNVTALLGIA